MPDFFDVATYDYNKAQNVLDIPETYDPIVSLVTPFREEGLYEIGMALSYTFDSNTTSVYLRFSIDGGGTWTEFINEPTDSLDIVPFVYLFPKVQLEGVFDMILEMRKESGVGDLDVAFVDIWYKRIGDTP